MENQTPSINALMAQAQAVMETPRKDGVNPHFHHGYTTLNECLRVVRNACNPLGLFVAFDIREGSVYTRVASATEELLLMPFPIAGTGNPQQKGSELSYAKRYSLCGAFGLGADEDDDGNAASYKGEETKYKAPVKPQKASQRPPQPSPLMDAYHALSKACRDRDEAMCLEPGQTNAEVKALPDFQDKKSDVAWVSGLTDAIERGDF